MTRPETLRAVQGEVRRLLGLAPGAPWPGVNAVISDMSPNISGVYSVDQARSLVLAGKALEASRVLLRPGGQFCVKVFEGEDFGELLGRVQEAFAFVKVHAPEASRKQSSEVYIIAKGFRARRGPSKRLRASEEE
jgi:23S rRNA (uridine2552-2'-O)-methyltransferase